MSAGKRIRYFAEFLLVRLMICMVQACSPRFTRRAARSLAWLICHVLPKKLTRYQLASEQIQAALGPGLPQAEVDSMILRMWQHLLSVLPEMLQLARKLRRENVSLAVQFRDKRRAVQALCAGRPVIVLSGHYGNWELAVAIFGLFGFRMGLVARDLDNPYLHRWLTRLRRSTGHTSISKKGAATEMTALLAAGGTVALLADQDAGSGGVFVDFFGRPASTYKSIALLALEYDALLCVGYARRIDEQALANGWPVYEYGCEEVIDPRDHQSADAVREITQRYTLALERVVRRAPEQYFWIHRRWKSVPKVRQRNAALRKAG